MWKPEHLVRRHLASGFFPKAIFHDVNILKRILRDWVEVGERTPLHEKKKFRAELEILIRPPPPSRSPQSSPSPLRREPFVYRMPMDLWVSLLPWDVQRGLSKADLSSLFSLPSPSTVEPEPRPSSSSSSSPLPPFSVPSISSASYAKEREEGAEGSSMKKTASPAKEKVEEEEDTLGVLFDTAAPEMGPPPLSSSSTYSSSLSPSIVPVSAMLFVLEVPPLRPQHGKVCFWSGAITSPIDVLFFCPFSYATASSSAAVALSPIAHVSIPPSSSASMNESFHSSAFSSSWSSFDHSFGRAPSKASAVPFLPVMRREGREGGRSLPNPSRHSPMALRTQDWDDRLSAEEGPFSREVATSYFPSVDMRLEIARSSSFLPTPPSRVAMMEKKSEEKRKQKTMSGEEEVEEERDTVEVRQERDREAGISFPPLPLHDIGHLDPFPFLSAPPPPPPATSSSSPSSFAPSASSPLCHQVTAQSKSPTTPPHYVLECPRYLLQTCIRGAYDRYRYYVEDAAAVEASASPSVHPPKESDRKGPPPAPRPPEPEADVALHETVEVSLHLSRPLAQEVVSQSQMVVGYVKALQEAIEEHMRDGSRPPDRPMGEAEKEEVEVDSSIAVPPNPEAEGEAEERRRGKPSCTPFASEHGWSLPPPSGATSVRPREEMESQPSHDAPSFLHPLHPRRLDAGTPSPLALDDGNARRRGEGEGMLLPQREGAAELHKRRANISLYGGFHSVAAAAAVGTPPMSAKKASLYPLTHAPPSQRSLLRPTVDYELIAFTFRLGIGLESVMRHYYERLLRDWRREVGRIRRRARRKVRPSSLSPSSPCSTHPPSHTAGHRSDAVGEEEEEEVSDISARDIHFLYDLVKDPALQFPEELGLLVEIVADARGLTASPSSA